MKIKAIPLLPDSKNSTYNSIKFYNSEIQSFENTSRVQVLTCILLVLKK